MSIIVCLVFAVIVAFIYTCYLEGQLKSVESQKGAAQYEKPGSFKLTEKTDHYLYKRVEKTAKPKK